VGGTLQIPPAADQWTVHPSSLRSPGRSRRLSAPIRLPRGAWAVSL